MSLPFRFTLIFAFACYARYTEMYVLTGEKRYLDAVLGAWDLWMADYIHVGGSMALNQGSPKPEGAPGTYAPGSYHLNECVNPQMFC